MAKKKNEEKKVIVVVGDWEIETDVKSVGNRKMDLAKALTFICNDDDTIDGDRKFAKDVEKEVNKLFEEMSGEKDADMKYWNSWKFECIMNLKDTFHRTAKSTVKKEKEKPNITLCFDNCDITVPFKISDNIHADLIKAVEWISSQPDIIEGDNEFAEELSGRISRYAVEMQRYKDFSFKRDVNSENKYSDWDDFVAKLNENIQRSLAIYKVKTFKIYDLNEKAKTIGVVTARLQNLHNLFLTKEMVSNGSKKSAVYKIFDYEDNLITEFNTLTQVYKYEFELSTKMLELSKGA